MNSWMFFVPVRVELESPRGLNYSDIVPRSRHKLQADREIFLGESARNGKCGKAAKVSNAAEWIGENQPSLKIQFQGE